MFAFTSASTLFKSVNEANTIRKTEFNVCSVVSLALNALELPGSGAAECRKIPDDLRKLLCIRDHSHINFRIYAVTVSGMLLFLVSFCTSVVTTQLVMVWVPVMVFTISMAIFFNKLHSHPDILEKLPKFMSDWIAQRKTNITSLSNSLQILCQHFKFYTFQFCFEIFYFNQRFIKQKGICSRPSASEYLRWKDRK